MLVLQFILGLQSQSIDFTNAYAQADITRGQPVFIEIPRDFNSDVGQCDVVLRLKKNLYGQAEASCLWYKKLRNDLLESGSMMSKVDPCLFMSKTFICVIYVDDCLYWTGSKSDIDKVMDYFKENGPSYIWEH